MGAALCRPADGPVLPVRGAARRRPADRRRGAVPVRSGSESLVQWLGGATGEQRTTQVFDQRRERMYVALPSISAASAEVNAPLVRARPAIRATSASTSFAAA